MVLEAGGWFGPGVVSDLRARAYRAWMSRRPGKGPVVLLGHPPNEAGITAIARELAPRLERLVWLDPPEFPVLDRVLDSSDCEVTLADFHSLDALKAVLAARTVIHTHQVLGLEGHYPGRAFINLWHGDGMKPSAPRAEMARRRLATLLVTASEVYGRSKAASFGVPSRDVLRTGSPRLEELRRPLEAPQLRSLGIRGPFVLVLPTHGEVATGNGSHPGEEAELAGIRRRLVEDLHVAGYGVVFKRHGLDHGGMLLEGAVEVTDAQLGLLGANLYNLLGASAALVTDVSSVQNEYLALDRPLGFVFPSGARWRGSCPVHPAGYLDRLPGTTIDGPAGSRRFLQDLAAGGALTRGRRAAAVSELGLVFPPHPARDLIDELFRRRLL